MEENPYNSTDLDSVLKTLSGLAPRSNSSIFNPAGTNETSSVAGTNNKHSNTPRQAPVHLPRPANTPTVDPSTITTWPTALRYVMHTVIQNEETQLRIRGLIRSQHSHERQWWNGREALVQRQQARGEKKKELDAVLYSIGVQVESEHTVSAKEEQAEIATYDAKVYKASAQMAEALIAELRGLKVPFFALQPSLIREPSSDSGNTSSKANETHQHPSSQLTKTELSTLQRRMLELLQDLCKE